jgi:hypothetical protein
MAATANGGRSVVFVAETPRQGNDSGVSCVMLELAFVYFLLK